jgi:hypothetical protein
MNILWAVQKRRKYFRELNLYTVAIALADFYYHQVKYRAKNNRLGYPVADYTL